MSNRPEQQGCNDARLCTRDRFMVKNLVKMPSLNCCNTGATLVSMAESLVLARVCLDKGAAHHDNAAHAVVCACGPQKL